MKGFTWGWMAMALALVVSGWLDLANVAQGGAIDFRNRITGERLLEHGIDAYHYKWHEGDPPEYCDVYNNPKLPVSKTTASPALLFLHLPLAALPYRPAAMLWFLVQWALLLGTAWLWLCLAQTSWQRLLVGLVFTGFTYTDAWRLHAERGQVYVLLLFVFALWLTFTLSQTLADEGEKSRDWIAGIIAGVLVALRPPFALLLPFLALHRRAQLPGAVVGLIFGIGLPLLVNSASWSDYASAMRDGSSLYRNSIDPRPGPNGYPPAIEGVPTDIMANFVPIPFADSSVHVLLKAAGLEPFPDWIVLLAVAVPFLCWLWLARAQTAGQLIAAVAAWLYLVDFFLPAYRNAYNDVLILNVAAALIVTSPKIPWAVWPCLVALPIGWIVYAAEPDQPLLINLPTLFFAVGAIMALFLFTNRGVVRKV